MSVRLSAVVDAVRAHWPDSETTWFVGAEHLHAHEGAENRIVVHPTNGPITEPGIAAQGHYLETLVPNAPAADSTSRDDILWQRRLSVNWVLWGSSYSDAEARLHALLAAMAEALTQSDITLADIREMWVRQGDVTSGGSMVVVSTTIPLLVLTQDVTLPDTPGEGVAIETVDQISVNMIHQSDAGDETIATMEIEETT
jgi:hypothetical protein